MVHILGGSYHEYGSAKRFTMIKFIKVHEDMTSFDLNANLRYICGMRLVESLTTLIVMDQISKAKDNGTKTYDSM